MDYSALQELGYQDICMVLGIPEGTVKTLVFRGKALLRARLSAWVGRPTHWAHLLLRGVSIAAGVSVKMVVTWHLVRRSVPQRITS
jgi:hypothetical protein